MHKNIFYNYKLLKKNIEIKKPTNTALTNKKKNVDINMLLNRVKINQHNEKKSKIIFFSFGVSLISFMGIFLMIIK